MPLPSHLNVENFTDNQLTELILEATKEIQKRKASFHEHMSPQTLGERVQEASEGSADVSKFGPSLERFFDRFPTMREAFGKENVKTSDSIPKAEIQGEKRARRALKRARDNRPIEVFMLANAQIEVEKKIWQLIESASIQVGPFDPLAEIADTVLAVVEVQAVQCLEPDEGWEAIYRSLLDFATLKITANWQRGRGD